jgi:hypothetical protein
MENQEALNALEAPLDLLLPPGLPGLPSGSSLASLELRQTISRIALLKANLQGCFYRDLQGAFCRRSQEPL